MKPMRRPRPHAKRFRRPDRPEPFMAKEKAPLFQGEQHGCEPFPFMLHGLPKPQGMRKKFRRPPMPPFPHPSGQGSGAPRPFAPPRRRAGAPRPFAPPRPRAGAPRPFAPPRPRTGALRPFTPPRRKPF